MADFLQTLREIGRSTQYTPYDVLGGPVDLATMLLRPFGYNVQNPVGGSDWLIQLAQKYGVANQPTGSTTENLTRLAAGIASPAAASKAGQAVFKAGEVTTEQVNRAADALVRAITQNPQATAPAVLEAAGGMVPLSRMFKPEQVKAILPKTKIVDESGNPQLLYHGTRDDFEQFDPGKRGAIFASPDPKFTNVFAGEDMDRYLAGGNVRPVYVDAKNPFDYDNPGHVQAVVRYIKKNDPDFADIAESIGEKVETGVYSQIERPLVQNAIRQLGFDGFFVQERGVKNIAVFDPDQIKSAISDPAFAGLLD